MIRLVTAGKPPLVVGALFTNGLEDEFVEGLDNCRAVEAPEMVGKKDCPVLERSRADFGGLDNSVRMSFVAGLHASLDFVVGLDEREKPVVVGLDREGKVLPVGGRGPLLARMLATGAGIRFAASPR
mmetsp:Transcript_115730/g.223102  ORF Transcript_115730/g.223102 Transcript_115730/m.223102 type:complete len:127 (+) Transcript_115730:924-1304(+)